MEEMNLTDEIIKALEFKAKFDAKVAYVDGCACKHIRVADILDLIRSLQQRVSILEADNDDYKMKIAENELVSIDWHYEQVLHLEEEIERLAEEKRFTIEKVKSQPISKLKKDEILWAYQMDCGMHEKREAELQKQVDDKKSEEGEIYDKR